MTREFNWQELTDLVNSLNTYKHLASYLPQISKEASLKEFCGKVWYKSQKVQTWNKINIHIVSQNWPSTSCGWGGMGGSAITAQYNVIIENKDHKAYYVFWNGKLAYIIKNDPIDFTNLPYIDEVPENILIAKGR